ncbi:hypothetical protein BH09PAT3_BH09PAT3_2310 [soil metagenome]
MSEVQENISVEVHLGPHNTRTDFAFFENALKDGVDVYVPEHNAYTQDDVHGYKKVASGDSKVYQKVRERLNPDSMFAAQFSALFASRVQVELFDVPAAEYYADSTALALLKDGERGANGSSADETVERFLASADLSARTTNLRNEKIARNLVTRLPGFVAQHPRLAQKDQVNVLVTLGDLHFQVPTLLGDSFAVSANEITQSDMAADEQCAVKMSLGEEIDEELVYRGAAAALLSPYVHGDDTAERRSTMNRIVQDAGQDEIEVILEARSGGPSVVHELLRSRLGYLGIEGGKDFQLTKPWAYAQYVPRMVNERVNGRVVAVSSLF